jgi:TetR/AcrR family transcriptional regulator
MDMAEGGAKDGAEDQSAHPATAQRIVDAARSLMIERDLLEVSIADISERAGTNVALVSYYFGNREGLMIAIVEGDARRAAGHLDRLLAADMTPTAKMERHIRGMIEAYFDRPYLNRLLHKLLREASPQASAKVGASFVRPVTEARRTMIADGVARGEFRAVDADLVSFAIDGACAHLFSSEQSRRTVLGDGSLDHDLIDRYVATVTDLIVGGLLAR